MLDERQSTMTTTRKAIAEIFRAARRRHMRHVMQAPKNADTDRDARRRALAAQVDDAAAARMIDELVADFAKLYADPEIFKGECSLPVKPSNAA